MHTVIISHCILQKEHGIQISLKSMLKHLSAYTSSRFPFSWQSPKSQSLALKNWGNYRVPVYWGKVVCQERRNMLKLELLYLFILQLLSVWPLGTIQGDAENCQQTEQNISSTCGKLVHRLERDNNQLWFWPVINLY